MTRSGLDGLVVALGGNALLREGEDGGVAQQRAHAEETFRALMPLLRQHERVLVVHGNGPQVGDAMLRGEIAATHLEPPPLDSLVAESQGGLGYLLQQVLGNLLAAEGLEREVVTVVTQVLVAADGDAATHPKKPVGRFHSAEEARELVDRHGWIMREDAGRGWRRVVPSPPPIAILEAGSVEALYRRGTVVIAAGGGGVPVARGPAGLRGVEAVIDKDLAAGLLAETVRPELLVILTAVEAVYTGWGTPAQQPLRWITPEELERHHAARAFGEGSMAPKVRCAARFVEAVGGRALITSAEALSRALAGTAGTWVHP